MKRAAKNPDPPGGQAAFTLLEVMIATAIFFMGMFALLGVMSAGLRAATLLRNNAPTAGMAVADLTLTNQLEEKSEHGDFGPVYPDFSWDRTIYEYATNGLFMIDVTVLRGDKVDSSMSILLYKAKAGGP